LKYQAVKVQKTKGVKETVFVPEIISQICKEEKDIPLIVEEIQLAQKQDLEKLQETTEDTAPASL